MAKNITMENDMKNIIPNDLECPSIRQFDGAAFFVLGAAACCRVLGDERHYHNIHSGTVGRRQR